VPSVKATPPGGGPTTAFRGSGSTVVGSAGLSSPSGPFNDPAIVRSSPVVVLAAPTSG
jgi:hypothetical protein